MSAPEPPVSSQWRRRLADAAEFIRRRAAGEYEVDPESGFDPELNRAVLMPAARGLYKEWFRVQMRGLEHVPQTGPAMLVANHSGVLPLDAVMLQVGVLDEHPAARSVRMLSADLVYSVPWLAWLARASGHVPANPEEAERLLQAGELVGVFPEGFKGIGKPFSDRYQLQRFGRGGFARTALRTGVPIIPVAIVGAEEIYPMVADWPELAAKLKLPYFPITPLFPWFGLLGAIPLPSKWLIEFCDPVSTNGFAPDQCEDAEVIAELADKVKDTIASKIDELLAERGPAFGDLPDPGPFPRLACRAMPAHSDARGQATGNYACSRRYGNPDDRGLAALPEVVDRPVALFCQRPELAVGVHDIGMADQIQHRQVVHGVAVSAASGQVQVFAFGQRLDCRSLGRAVQEPASQPACVHAV